MDPPHTVPIQLKVLMAEGTAITIVENENVAESKVVVFAFSNPLAHQGKPHQLSGVIIPTKTYSFPSR